jgi:A/G-specific adenine glycosylase
MAGEWMEAGTLHHVFTHFALTLAVRVLRISTAIDLDDPALDVTWWPVDEISTAGLPSLFVKARMCAMEYKE